MPPDLNPEQRRAAEAPHRPLLIVAGAGTGKTRTLTSRIIHLVNGGVPPEMICAITFTNKAAKEMAERVETHLPTGDRNKKPWIGTFHALGARILRAECRLVGRTIRFAIFDDNDSGQVMKKIVKEMGLDRKDQGPAFFLNRISAMKNGMLRKAELESSDMPRDRLVLKVAEAYEKELARQNAFDFDDLLVKVVWLFRHHPDLLAKYQKRWPYLLVDEYQDLNNTQYEMIRLLAGESGRLSVVGDDQQTIYSWRGSNFEIFLNFERDWPDSIVVVLDQNYRSSGNIIGAASALIAHNKRQKPKKLWTEKPDGEPVRIVEANGEDDEAWWVANRIQETGAASTAILYRTNAQSRPIEQALIERGIPYRVYGGLKFYERREIKDIVAALRYASNPQDEVSADRLLKTFRKTKFAALRELLDANRDRAPFELIPLIIKEAGYVEYLEKNFTNSLERRENLAELMHFAAQFEDISSFLEQITLLQATDAVTEERGTEPINLMTMHLAKGLEFNRVFIIGATEGILPHARSMDSDAEIEEERRLMYVAMTRAREELIISFYDLPSRFLSELPSDRLAFESLVSDDRFFEDKEERWISWD